LLTGHAIGQFRAHEGAATRRVRVDAETVNGLNARIALPFTTKRGTFARFGPFIHRTIDGENQAGADGGAVVDLARRNYCERQAIIEKHLSAARLNQIAGGRLFAAQPIRVKAIRFALWIFA
jgi:hypothetical protein